MHGDFFPIHFAKYQLCLPLFWVWQEWNAFSAPNFRVSQNWLNTKIMAQQLYPWVMRQLLWLNIPTLDHPIILRIWLQFCCVNASTQYTLPAIIYCRAAFGSDDTICEQKIVVPIVPFKENYQCQFYYIKLIHTYQNCMLPLVEDLQGLWLAFVSVVRSYLYKTRTMVL